MSILNDAQIRRAAERGMLDPFIPHLVRSHKPGYRVVSYGLTSFGYDLRLSDADFCVFSPITGRDIDVKEFNADALIQPPLHDATDGSGGAYFLLPPHTYALGVTVETIRMPDNLVSICLGKSTYARCFSGNTRIALANGTSVSFEEMARGCEKGEIYFGYSVNQDGRIEVAHLTQPRYIGTESVVKIVLDTGEDVICTPDHEIMTRDGSWVQAANMRPGQSLMPLYRKIYRGYEGVYQPQEGRMYPTHRLADEWNLRFGVYEARQGDHRHHVDHDKLNNYPWNIERVHGRDHVAFHNEEYYGEVFDSTVHGEKVKIAYEQLRQDDEWFRAFRAQQVRKARTFWDDPRHEESRRRWLEKARERWTQEYRDARSRSAQEFYNQHPEYRDMVALRSREWWSNVSEERRQKQREIARAMNTRTDITEDDVRRALQETGTLRGASRLLNCDRSVFRRFPDVVSPYKRKVKIDNVNHKIVSIEPVKGCHDVYCLTAPEAGNFALESGIFVKNCGLIVNTTPMEPGWRGRLVLEFSNSADLPIKLYANEGICQAMFFEGERPETTYGDRGGKYQNQTGLTLAKV